MHAILTVIGQGRIHYEKILSVREKILDASAEFNIIFPYPNILHRDETESQITVLLYHIKKMPII